MKPQIGGWKTGSGLISLRIGNRTGVATMPRGRNVVTQDEVEKMAGLPEYPSDTSPKIFKFHYS